MAGWPRKIVICRGYGSPLSADCDEPWAQWLCEHPELVAAVERKEVLVDEDGRFVSDIVKKIQVELSERFDANAPLYALNQDPTVVEVKGPYRVLEYDGAEYVEEQSEVKWRT